MNLKSPPRQRLIDAAVTLLGEHPQREPTTRELCALAGVTAPSLYHHFGDKDGLLAQVLEEAFAAYLDRKRASGRTGDLVDDFAAGWDMHLRFGLANPLLYSAMFASAGPRGQRATQLAADELRRELESLDRAGLLRLPVDTAASVTLAASVGCVLQLVRDGGTVDGPVSRELRDSLLHQLFGTTTSGDRRGGTAQDLLADLAASDSTLGAEESALMRKWLVRLRQAD